VQVACWCIGEYGAHLLNGVSIEGETITVSEDDVIDVYRRILFASHISVVTKQYGLVSITKLSTRFPSATPKIQEIIAAFGSHLQIDLQQRGVEFTQLFTRFEGMRSALLEPMPAFERDAALGSNPNANAEAVNGGSTPNGNGVSLLGDIDKGSDILGGLIGTAPGPAVPSKDTNSLMDLLDLDLAPPSNRAPLSLEQPPAKDNLLGGLLGFSATLPTANNATFAPTNSNLLEDDLLGGLGSSFSSSLSSSHIPAAAATVAYNANGILVSLESSGPSGGPSVTLTLQARNSNAATVTDFVFQAAVPKSMQLELLPASGSAMDPLSGSLTQVLRVSNPSGAALKMRVRISYVLNGQPVQYQGEVAGIP
jgi:AP-1 complex subunit gamma-1